MTSQRPPDDFPDDLRKYPMKQVVQTLRTGVIEVADVPIPGLNDGWVLVRTTASVISAGTEKTKIDMGNMNLLQKAKARPDLVRQVVAKAKSDGLAKTFRTVEARLGAASPLGYSSAGVVVAVGGLVKGIAVGDRVACAGAGYANHAEFVGVPANLVAVIPSGVTDEAAAFTTLGSIALQGIRLADPKLGEKFLVVGLGLLGQITTQLLLANGCGVVGYDLNDWMVERTRSLGVEAYGAGADIDRICRDFSDQAGVDGVLITAGTSSNAPIELAGRVTRKRGRVIVVGAVKMDIPREDYFKKELGVSISCSYGPGRYDPTYEEGGQDYPIGYVRFTEKRNMESFLDAMNHGRVKVEPLVTHRFSIDQAAAAYGLMTKEGHEPHVAIVLEYQPPSGASTTPQTGGRIEISAKPIGVPLIASFVGAGNYATATLLPALQSSTKFGLNGLMTQSGRSAQGVAKQHGFAFCTDRFDDLLTAETHAVFVTTRHDSHAKLVISALAAGKHVFVEKPLAITMPELHDVVAAEAASAGSVMVGFNRRFAPMTIAAYEHLAASSGSRVINIRVNAGTLSSDHWMFDPANGGRFIGEGCHFVDLACSFVASPVTEVFAFAHSSSAVSAVTTDNITALLRFEDGSVATIAYLSVGGASLPKEYIEVHGGGRSVTITDFKSLVLHGGDAKPKESSAPQNKGQVQMVAALESALKQGIDTVPFDQLVRSSAAAILVTESLTLGVPLRVDDALSAGQQR
jgi:predicted dehydrogenase/threonine dehydrogenase-like Zn-dependent dehydrogenase